MAGSDQARRATAPLRLYIFLLAAAVSLPLVGLAGYLLHDLNRTTQQLNRQTALIFTRQLATDIEKRLQGYVSALEALRTSPSLRNDLSAFYQQAVDVARANDVAIVLRDEGGQQLLNTLRPFGVPLPRSTDAALVAADRETRETGQPTVSALYMSAVAQQFYLAIVVPVGGNDDRRVVLNIGLRPAKLVSDLQAATPGTWTSAVVDQTARIVARSKEPERYLGAQAVGVDPTVPEDERVWIGETAAGERVLAAQVRVRRTGWVVAVGIPLAEISTATGIQPLSTLILTASALTLSLVAALFFTRWLQKPLDQLRGLPLAGPASRFGVRELDVAIRELDEGRERQRELMREVNHRAKNLLSVVLAIARMTAGSRQYKDYARQLSQRIAGLAASHDLLVENEWREIDLADLVTAQLKMFGGLGVRIPAGRPAVAVNPVAAQAIGMALHELATNTLKHSPGGRVLITWMIEGDAFCLSWQERTASISEDVKAGFGRRLLTTYVEQSLSGTVDYRLEADGILWRLRAPIDQVGSPHSV